MNILIVDDDFIIRECLQEFFKMSGKFSIVEVAEEGNSALSKMKQSKFDILLTDINMPNGMGGFDLVNQTKDISCILAFSGNSENAEKAKLDSKIKKFYQKPITNPKKFIEEVVEEFNK